MEKQVKRAKARKNRFVKKVGLAAKVALADTDIKVQYPAFEIGDDVKVHVRIKEGEKERIQIFEGLVMKFSNHGKNRAFTVRKVSHGVGVERVFLMNSPKVANLEVIKRGKVRRAKLYYMRNLRGKAARLKERDQGKTKAQLAKAQAVREANKQSDKA